MNIPSSIKIGVNRFKIIHKKSPESEASFGEIDWGKKTIWINDEFPQEIQEQTLFHEILHGINQELKEPEVEFISQAFYTVLKENNLLK